MAAWWPWWGPEAFGFGLPQRGNGLGACDRCSANMHPPGDVRHVPWREMARVLVQGQHRLFLQERAVVCPELMTSNPSLFSEFLKGVRACGAFVSC